MKKYEVIDEFDDVDEFDDEMSDEELDELYRPKKMNSRKALLPLFVYQVLTQETNCDKHYTQNDIIRALSGFPYEISIERKALSRTLHALCDSGIGIQSNPKMGSWYDPKTAW